MSSLRSHENNGVRKTNIGYYDSNNGFPITDINAIPRRFRRIDKEEKPIGPGTDIYIIGFRDELPENVLEAADVFRSAMDKYLEKNFTESRELFEKAAALVPGDESPLVYAHRCGEFIEKGIHENWNGVITLTTK